LLWKQKAEQLTTKLLRFLSDRWPGSASEPPRPANSEQEAFELILRNRLSKISNLVAGGRIQNTGAIA
jgi:hypothetical protein